MKGSRLVSRRINSTKYTISSNSTPNNSTKATTPTTDTTSITTSIPITSITTIPTSTTTTKTSNNSSSANASAKEEQICNICAQNVPGPEREKIFAYGKCDHHVCYVCSARLRVICEQSECPICREKLEYVLFASSKAKPFDKHNLKNHILDEKYKIYFESESIKEAFEKLLRFECQECCNKSNSNINKQEASDFGQQSNNANKSPIKSNKNSRIEEDAQGLLESSSQINETKFADVFGLKNHLNYVHKLNLCDLCLTHNKLFPFEYSYYNKMALKKHKESGEPKTSHRGHPSCFLCRQTFFNFEEMLLHMSREHYHCHLCGRHDSNMIIYFLDYNTLREHFKSKHILCERDNCRHEQFISVFDNEIDYHVHLCQYHPSTTAGLSRGEVRHQRTITLEQPAYRRRDGVNNNPLRNSNLPPNTAVVSTGPRATANSDRQQRPSESIPAQIRQQRLPTRAEFPALGQTSVTPSSQAVTISNMNPYPSLPTMSNSTTSSVNNNTNNSTGARSTAVISTLSQRVTAGSSSSSSSLNTRGSFVRTLGAGYRPPERLNEMEFPPLPEQPKVKANKKPKKRIEDVNEPLSLEQLISTSLTLTNRNTKLNGKKKIGSKAGTSAKASKKPFKIQL